jgi:hypothetical protein
MMLLDRLKIDDPVLAPIITLFDPDVTALPDNVPINVLFAPFVLIKPELNPMAVLFAPVLNSSALDPMAMPPDALDDLKVF